MYLRLIYLTFFQYNHNQKVKQSNIYNIKRQKFLAKIYLIKALLQNTFDNCHQQYDKFLDNEDLIDNYPVLYSLINDLFHVARRQKTHETYLIKNRNIGNTYDNDLSETFFSEYDKSVKDNISSNEQSSPANNFFTQDQILNEK